MLCHNAECRILFIVMLNVFILIFIIADCHYAECCCAIIRLEVADTCPELWLIAALFYLLLLNDVMLIIDIDLRAFCISAFKCN
jgi:hypothetical protein